MNLEEAWEQLKWEMFINDLPYFIAHLNAAADAMNNAANILGRARTQLKSVRQHDEGGEK